MDNIFALATRKAIRFPSNQGLIDVEQLWDLPLTARNTNDLDTVAKNIHRELTALNEESFVATKTNPAKADKVLAMDVVKFIISVKLAEAEEAQNARAKKAEREKLLGILEVKEAQALNDLSADEIRQRLAALED